MKLIAIFFISIFVGTAAAQFTEGAIIPILLMAISALTVNYFFIRRLRTETANNLAARLLKEHQFKASKVLQDDTFYELLNSEKEIQILVDETSKKTCVTTTASSKKEPKVCMLNNFICTQNINIHGSQRLLMLDENSNFLCIIDYSETNPTSTFISHSSILSSEIYEGGVSVTESKRLSQIGGAIVGGALLGGVGAIIGGLSGKKKTSELTNDITLRLCINDTKNPIIDLQFLNEETAKNGNLYKHYSEQARRWHTLFSILIKKADSESATSGNLQSTFTGNISEEIKRLLDLKELGAITEEEFSKLKAKLIS